VMLGFTRRLQSAGTSWGFRYSTTSSSGQAVCLVKENGALVTRAATPKTYVRSESEDGPAQRSLPPVMAGLGK
jgi:hypothetical protein